MKIADYCVRKIRRSIKLVLREAGQLGLVWPFVMFYSRIIEVVRPFKEDIQSDIPTILALSPDRFVGDLAILSNSKCFRVMKLPLKWQSKILAIFGPTNISELMGASVYYNPGDNKYLIEVQGQLRMFLKKFLASLYSRLKIDCVIGAAIHYKRDYDWGLVSDEIGVPYIVLHKENIYMPKAYELLEAKYRKFGKFKGSQIVVHSVLMKDFFIKSGYCNPDNISALGCLRMDEFVKKVKLSSRGISKKRIGCNKKKVTLFSFTYGYMQVGLSGFEEMVHFPKNRDKGFVKLFENVHTSIAKLACNNKNIDFVIKPKWGGNWIDAIEYVFSKNNIESKRIDNLFIDSDINVHDLILESDVICAFTSTTVLEAAISAKPVIIPYFDEALKAELNELIEFKDNFNLMDIAYSPDEFERLIIERLNSPEVTQKCIKERYALFEKYVSSMEGDALDKYVNVINQVIKERQCVGYEVE